MSEMKFLTQLTDDEFGRMAKTRALGNDLRSLLHIPFNKPVGIGDTTVRIGRASEKKDVFVVEKNGEKRFYVVIEPMDDELAFCYSIYPQ